MAVSSTAVEVSLAPVDVIRPSLPASRGRIVVRAGLEVCRTDARDADRAIVVRAFVIVLLAVLLGCPEGNGMWKRCDSMCQSRAVGKEANSVTNRYVQCFLQHSAHLAVGAAVSEARKDLHLGV